MKCVGIIGAMEQEVARLKEVMEDVSITTRANMDFVPRSWQIFFRWKL